MKDFFARCLGTILKEWILVLSFLGLVATSLYLKRLPSYSLQDIEIIYILWVLFISIKGLERESFFSYVGGMLKKSRLLPLRLVLGTLILSMIVTNDVALLIVVPLTLNLEIEKKEFLIILEALAVNAGSALTPFGNPQNLFIYWFYHLHLREFVYAIFPFFGFLGGLLLLFSLFFKVDIRDVSPLETRFSPRVLVHLGLLGVSILAILKVVPLYFTVVTIIYVLLWDRECFRVDYILLLTFFTFFGFTDNLMHLLNIRIETSSQVFLSSAIFSQFISNVPAALLFSDFTTNWRALLWGVSVGGFGNLIGSLANLIAYRFVTRQGKPSPRFMFNFLLLGYIAFSLGILLYFIVEEPMALAGFLHRVFP